MPELFKQLFRIPLSFHFEGSMSTTRPCRFTYCRKISTKGVNRKQTYRKAARKNEDTYAFISGRYFIFNLRSNEKKYNNSEEDGVTKPFSRAFCEKLGQGPDHSEVLLCSQKCVNIRECSKRAILLYFFVMNTSQQAT